MGRPRTVNPSTSPPTRQSSALPSTPSSAGSALGLVTPQSELDDILGTFGGDMLWNTAPTPTFQDLESLEWLGDPTSSSMPSCIREAREQPVTLLMNTPQPSLMNTPQQSPTISSSPQVAQGPTIPLRTHQCLCNMAVIEKLRAILRNLSSTPSGKLEQALETVTLCAGSCSTSIKCHLCASDKSTPITAFSLVSIALQILQAAIPSIQNADSQHPIGEVDVQIGQFRTSGRSATRLAFIAIESEIADLSLSCGTLFERSADAEELLCNTLKRQLKVVQCGVRSIRSNL